MDAHPTAYKAVARTLSGWCIFIYACFAKQVSFQIDQFELGLKRNWAEHEYMNIRPLKNASTLNDIAWFSLDASISTRIETKGQTKRFSEVCAKHQRERKTEPKMKDI